MSYLYLVRHGRAGSLEKDYDQLISDGFEQAEKLARQLISKNIRIDLFAAGTLRRQRETAETVQQAYDKAGLLQNSPCPGIIEIPELNEFAPEMWKSVAEHISKTDPVFRRRIQKYIDLHRRQMPAARKMFVSLSEKIIETWAENDNNTVFPGIPPFVEFQRQVMKLPQIFQNLKAEYKLPANGGIFAATSSTPVAMMIGHSLNADLAETLSMMRMIANSSLSIFYLKNRNFEPVTLNSLLHLDPEDVSLF